MKQLILAMFFVAALGAPVASQAHNLDRLQDHVQVSFTGSPSQDIVREAILTVGKSHGWSAAQQSPGKMRMTNVIRGTFTVVVDVTYSSTGMQVDYVSSENLNYKLKNNVPWIHPKYNKWVQTLMQETATNVST
jgi:hypothetical protein